MRFRTHQTSLDMIQGDYSIFTTDVNRSSVIVSNKKIAMTDGREIRRQLTSQ